VTCSFFSSLVNRNSTRHSKHIHHHHLFLSAAAVISGIGLSACGGSGPADTAANEQQRLLSQTSSSTTTPCTFAVNTLADTHDATLGDGKCLDAGGNCSLRAAIEESNLSPSFPVETIRLPAGTYTLTLGGLRIEKSLNLRGTAASTTIIDGNGRSRVIGIFGGASPIVSMSNVTVQNGNGSTDENGGGIYVASGAYLSVSRSVIRNNRGSIFGGGFSVGGQLLLVESTVSGNSLPLSEGGGQTASGGGVFLFSSGVATIDKSTINDNEAVRGGGIRNAGGRLEITNSTISGNRANTRGGGIMNFGTANIAYTTITQNRANVSLVGASEDTFGGGIYNAADAGATISLGNSIVAGNTDRRSLLDPQSSPDCYSVSPATLTSFRGNLVGVVNTRCNLRDTIFGDLTFDQAGTAASPLDPLLDPLVANGGPTRTHALRTGSPAINRGTGVTSATFFDCPATDQRLVARPAGGACDVGAYERSGT
jgi:CSLREA domain-containing protein